MQSEAEKRFKALVRKSPKTKEEMLELAKVQQIYEQELSDQEKLLIDELRQAGISIRSIWDLVNYRFEYVTALDILGSHLIKPYHYRIKEGIVRSLAIKEAKGKFIQALVNEYLQTPKNIESESLRYAIGNTVYYTITKNDLDLLIPIVRDRGNGKTRSMFVAALGKFKSNKVEKILEELCDDPDVNTDAAKALSKIHKHG